MKRFTLFFISGTFALTSFLMAKSLAANEKPALFDLNIEALAETEENKDNYPYFTMARCDGWNMDWACTTHTTAESCRESSAKCWVTY